MKKIVSIIIMLMVMLMMSYISVQAGMADFTDKEADEIANKQLQEQQNELSGIENKSTNNFLESLSVKGYTINFDKQTVNYDIGETNNTTIEITAEAEDEKATVNGAGKVELKAGENNIRVDVVAESGTTRTYFIKVVCTSKNVSSVAENTENNAEINIESPVNLEISQNENTKNYKNIVLGVVILVAFVVIIFIAIRGKK